MPTETETYTLSEAAVVTQQSVTTINRLIDSGPIAKQYVSQHKRQTRVLTKPDLLFLTALQDALLSTVSKASRARLYTQIRESWQGEDESPEALQISESVVVQLHVLVKRLLDRLVTFQQVKDFVEVDPEVRGGEPVVRGTRIPVQLVADMLDQGASKDEILRGYPTLAGKPLDLARVYARAYPKQGRPPKHPWHG